MLTLTGSPMYNYTLAKELKRLGHDVYVFSVFGNNQLRSNLYSDHINLLTKLNKNIEYDLVLISQAKFEKALKQIAYKYVINIVHSEYAVETPIINSIDHYIAIRPSIKDLLIEKYNINTNKIDVVYNGVDFQRFNPNKRRKHDGTYTKIVIPCTIDKLRESFIDYYEKKANENFRVFFYGKNYQKREFANKWVTWNSDVFDIENYICDADYVAGILLGRVNLEAKAMGIPSYIHNPKDPTDFYLFDLDEAEFDRRHNIENVAKSILDIYINSSTMIEKNNAIIHQEEKDRIDATTKKIFTNLYKASKRKYFSASGSGSDLSQTETLRSTLPDLFKTYNIKSILDIPCGDFYWMRETDLTNIEYIGADIVDEIVYNCSKNHPYSFKTLDVVNSKLPNVDLIFNRDCFVLLPNNMVKKAIENIKNSGSKYLLSTSFIKCKTNVDTNVGAWRPINLIKEPFNLGEPLLIINENCTESNGKYNDKSMCLWKL